MSVCMYVYVCANTCQPKAPEVQTLALYLYYLFQKKCYSFHIYLEQILCLLVPKK